MGPPLLSDKHPGLQESFLLDQQNGRDSAHPAKPSGLEGLLGCSTRPGPLLRSPGARGPSSLSSSHFHLMVTDTALMSEGDNTWELKITIAST